MFNNRSNKSTNSNGDGAVDMKRKAIEKRGMELMEISNKRLQSAGALEQEDLVPAIYVFCAKWDYVILKAGLDVPMYDDGSTRNRIKGSGFLPLGDEIYVHAGYVAYIDFDKLELGIDVKLNKNMENLLRADDVIGKLNAHRVSEKSSIFRFDSACSPAIKAIVAR